ncbi:type II secretion system protein GspC [Granulosicoccus antarcticus]|uniref:Type II secretion system protein C n=1 Tax=Granulosicoccus antarcticus IMCC3135 TaxID=1192854 RepID=A0A2Z2NJC4_9GAMM|nr:type II secretion system protein GspC [Granulosicoccus antarcticus]ASJ71279.1 Type II secretion system protein C [Granulosicoccus antarcticus IMCC3135]
MSATASSLATSDNNVRLPRLANTVLVAGIGVALAVITLKLLPASDPAPLLPVTAVNAVSNNSPGPTELAGIISSLHLFGDASKKPVAVEKVKIEEPLKDTGLNLQLAGVFAYEPQDQAIAIISAGSAEQNAYGIGDKISGETSLEAVYTDHVVLRNRGKLEKLSLPENVQPTAARPVERASSQASQEQDFSQPVELPSNPRELRDTLARNPSMLGRVVAAEPYQENGKLVGYRITPKQNPEILESQGIVAGDIITSVNNIQLNSQKQGIRALRNAVKAESLDVVILRDGIEVPISISLAQ